MIRRLLGFILSVIVAIILFILLIALFPSRKKTVNVINMRYVFVDSDGKEYNLFNDDFVNGYVLTEEQYNDLSNWLKISSFKKQQATLIKNYGSAKS